MQRAVARGLGQGGAATSPSATRLRHGVAQRGTRVETMRQIGSLENEEQVRRLAGHLFTLGIKTHVDSSEGGWVIWAYDEDKVAQAREEFSRFLQNPEAEEYERARRQADGMLRAEFERRRSARRHGAVDMRKRWEARGAGGARLTWLVIAACIAVAFWSNFGGTDSGVSPRSIPPVVRQLAIVNLPADTSGSFIRLFSRKSDVARGEVWRLVTPVFLHFHPLHLAFNMISFASVGRLIEARYGTWRLAWLMLSIAAVSNVAQYWYTNHPMFGGLSGVVFGLFGYVWIKGEIDPAAGFRLQPASVITMLIFLVLCMTGAFGPIANTAHVVGLIMGMVWAALPTLLHRFTGRS